jgi:hypothetical protein
MKEYFVNDEQGRKHIIEKDNGIKIEILEEPSLEYIAKMPPPDSSLPKPRDYLAEIDELKTKMEDLEKKIK